MATGSQGFPSPFERLGGLSFLAQVALGGLSLGKFKRLVLGLLKGQVFWGRGRRAEGSYLLRSLFFSFRLLLRLRDLQEAETRSEHHRGCRVTIELWVPAELDKELQFAPLRPKPPWHMARLHAGGCACMWCWGRIRGVHIPPSHARPVCNLLLSI